MDKSKAEEVAAFFGAGLVGQQRLQSLWSGYGEICRLRLDQGRVASLIYKDIRPPAQVSHPRGWAGERGHRRKLRSYEVELAFYRHYAPQCPAAVRVAECYRAEQTGDGFELWLEDLAAAGFRRLPGDGDLRDAALCLDWLAGFHAHFLGVAAPQLWEQGTYWHLDTRPDELAAMSDARLRAAAPLLDQQLRGARYQTLVHGDAKIANFLIDDAAAAAAAVDFQYVGAGCGIRDVAYLIGSTLSEAGCEQHAEDLLDYYLDSLRRALHSKSLDAQQTEAIISEWRALYPVAWTDFYRFLQGWCPDHGKVHAYTRKLAQMALN
ncbi:phosphotransferase [Granulosicoccaceae sp. 1_MG-2023]|nr:phosphotransferase [Granulosicoccaceae sp. 1_MG-2023]